MYTIEISPASCHEDQSSVIVSIGLCNKHWATNKALRQLNWRPSAIHLTRLHCAHIFRVILLLFDLIVPVKYDSGVLFNVRLCSAHFDILLSYLLTLLYFILLYFTLLKSASSVLTLAVPVAQLLSCHDVISSVSLTFSSKDTRVHFLTLST